MPRSEKNGGRVTRTPFMTQQKRRALLDPTVLASRPADVDGTRRTLGSCGAVSG